jgi:hypothetical protein
MPLLGICGKTYLLKLDQKAEVIKNHENEGVVRL